MFLRLLIVAFLILRIGASRILFIAPTPSLSHNVFFQPVIKELCARGHHVVSITPDLIKTPVENLIQIDVRNETYGNFNIGDWLAEMQKENPGMVEAIRRFLQNSAVIIAAVITKPEIQHIYNNERFDLIIIENIQYLIFHQWKNHFNCPIVGIGSLDLLVSGADNVGAPIFPSYHVDMHGLSGELNFWERLSNFWHALVFRWFWNREVVPTWIEMQKRVYGENVNFYEVQRNFDLVLINSNFAFQVPRPLPPAVIQIGGLHTREREEIPTVRSYIPQNLQSCN